MAQQNKEAHPNIYKAVTLFKSEQATTEASLMELATGESIKISRIDSIIKEKYKARDYTLPELLRAYSHWISL